MKGNMTKIMLVEDDKSLREIYGVRLLAEGYDIVSAGDGEEALAMAIKDRPQLIISDVMMPKISGFDMLDILRSTTETKDIKVIMMTALSSDEQRQRGEQLGADKYLVKSQVGIEDVVKAVHEVLGDKPNTQGPVTPSQPIGPNAGNTPVSDVARPAAPAAPSSTIPEPTAPFTGQRPANLGERVIQPLKDNPRVSNVDVGELMNKEFASNIQGVEDLPEPADLNVDVNVAQSSPPASNPVATPAPTTAPIQSVGAVSMDPPTSPQPAADDMTLPDSAMPSIPQQPTYNNAAIPPAPAPTTPDPVVTSPLEYEEPSSPAASQQPPVSTATPPPATTASMDTPPISVPERSDTITPPERS